METAWPLLLFLFGLFGFAMLILLGGIQGRELERAEDRGDAEPALRRSFFATIGAAFDAEPENEVDHGLVAEVESRVRRKTKLAARFVDRPSIDAFHEDEEAPFPVVVSTFDRIESFLRRECTLAGQFISDPTLDRFQEELVRMAA